MTEYRDLGDDRRERCRNLGARIREEMSAGDMSEFATLEEILKMLLALVETQDLRINTLEATLERDGDGWRSRVDGAIDQINERIGDLTL